MSKDVKARVDHEDEQAKYVLDVNGNWHTLVKGSINGTPAPVGANGVIRWSSSSSYHLPFFCVEESTNELWKQQPPCNICNEQHAGYEKAHTEAGDRTDYSANFTL